MSVSTIVEDKTLTELKEIVWRLGALKDVAVHLRRKATTEEDFTYDHLLLLGEMTNVEGLDRAAEKNYLINKLEQLFCCNFSDIRERVTLWFEVHIYHICERK